MADPAQMSKSNPENKRFITLAWGMSVPAETLADRRNSVVATESPKALQFSVKGADE
jgi:hypothetical protein